MNLLLKIKKNMKLSKTLYNEVNSIRKLAKNNN